MREDRSRIERIARRAAVPVGSVKSTSIVLLTLYKLCFEAAKVCSNGSLDVQEIESLDARIAARLQQKFQESSRRDHLLPALRKLHELCIIEELAEEDDGTVSFECVNQPFFLFFRFNATLSNGARFTRDELLQKDMCQIRERGERISYHRLARWGTSMRGHANGIGWFRAGAAMMSLEIAQWTSPIGSSRTISWRASTKKKTAELCCLGSPPACGIQTKTPFYKQWKTFICSVCWTSGPSGIEMARA